MASQSEPFQADSELVATAGEGSLRQPVDETTTTHPRETGSPPYHSILWRGCQRCASLLEWLFGLLCLIVCLALAASIPIVQFASLGYLLEVSGRIVRRRQIRAGFFGMRQAGRLGSLLLGSWLSLLPARFVAEMAFTAELLEPASGVARGWRFAAVLIAWLSAGHVLLAWYCGGRIRHFLWPILAPLFVLIWLLHRGLAWCLQRSLWQRWLERLAPRLLRELADVPSLGSWFPPLVAYRQIRQGGALARARDELWDFAAGLRLPYCFWLGFRGFLGAGCWLALPILLLIATTQLRDEGAPLPNGLAALLGLAGSLLLALVVLYLPFLQTHFAAERRGRAFLEVGEVRRMFRSAPIAYWFALVLALAFALPLYLLKLELIPREVAWAPSLIFVVFIFPARVAVGWALARGRARSRPRHALARWLARFAAIPIVLIYVLVVYLTQYTSWYGAWSLFEQHAFLLPVPFLSL